MPELRGVLQHPELHARYATVYHNIIIGWDRDELSYATLALSTGGELFNKANHKSNRLFLVIIPR